MRLRLLFAMRFLLLSSFAMAGAQTTPPAVGNAVPPALSGGDKFLGGYGPYRANNDLLYYNLHVRVDPAKQFLSGNERYPIPDAGGWQTHPTRPGANVSD